MSSGRCSTQKSSSSTINSRSGELAFAAVSARKFAHKFKASMIQPILPLLQLRICHGTLLQWSLVITHQLQHLAVELMDFPILIGYVPAVAVEHSKGSPKIPHRPAPARLPPQLETIAHPRQHHRVRCGRECSPLADVHTHTFLLQG